MSPDIAVISVISAAAKSFAAAGVTSGAKTSPTTSETASKRPKSRRISIAHHHMRSGTWEGLSLHMFARGVSWPDEGYRLTEDGPSTRDFGANKLHERLSARRPKKDHVVFPWRSAFHSRRSGWHAWNRQSYGGRPLLQQLPNG